MGIRFRKSFKLAPGLRMNLSGSGVSWTVGPRGASVGFSKRGTFLNTGIPGTGFYQRQLLSGGSGRSGGSNSGSSSRGSSGQTVNMNATVSVQDDGTITFKDTEGNPLSEYLVEQAKKQNRESILGLLKSSCDKINESIQAVGKIHLDTPSPDDKPTFDPPPFEERRPTLPTPITPSFFAGLFRSKREEIAQKNAECQRAYEAQLSAWEQTKAAYDAEVSQRRKLVEEDIYADPVAMEQFLQESLNDISWPRETSISFEVTKTGDGTGEGLKILLDVDLPEIEQMPNKTASVPQRGMKLSVKGMPATKIRQLYMDHVHGVIFRIIGEAFAALPKVQTVVVSGYSQRPDKATGRIADEYLLSLRVNRDYWSGIDFTHLALLDPVEALGRFEARRTLRKDGSLVAVEPFTT